MKQKKSISFLILLTGLVALSDGNAQSQAACTNPDTVTVVNDLDREVMLDKPIITLKPEQEGPQTLCLSDELKSKMLKQSSGTPKIKLSALIKNPVLKSSASWCGNCPKRPGDQSWYKFADYGEPAGVVCAACPN